MIINCPRCCSVIQGDSFIECQNCKLKYLYSTYRIQSIIQRHDLLVWRPITRTCAYWRERQNWSEIGCQLPYLPFDITAHKLKTYLLFS